MKTLTPILVVVTLVSLISVSPAATASTLYVGPGETYTEIQPAIDAAVDGVDTVVVRDGTYTGADNKNLDFGGKAITLESENGPDSCVIDCEYSGRGFTFHNGETSSAVLDGFTITNGSGVDRGGAIHCDNGSSPTIANCVITGNTASAGDGGGFWLGHGSSPHVKNCLIKNNSCVSAGGGAFLCYRSSNPIIENCTIVENTAPSVNPLPIGNGIYGMIGGGIYVDGSHVTLTNSIVWGNVAGRNGDQIAVIDIQGPSSITVSYSDVQGGVSEIYNHGSAVNWLAGNIDLNPLFLDAGDYHLQSCSPCIDKGDSVSPYSSEPLPNGALINMGAYGNTAEATDSSQIIDDDGDGFSECENDCDDTPCPGDPSMCYYPPSGPWVNPDAPELPGNLVDENCDGSLGACNPNAEWKNHGQYVRCVAHETDALIEAGYLTQEEGDELISSAAQSNVGKK